MAEFNQFGSAQPVGSGPGPGCAQCEAMLADAVDGTLLAADQAAFDRHIATCAMCSQMLADAQRGAALLSMLKRHRPEPSADLLDRILAQTSGAAIGAAEALPGLATPLPAAAGLATVAPFPGNAGKLLPFPSRLASRFNLRAWPRTIGQAMLQPRLAMTAAMAFFSIALTLNLTGVHLDQLRAADLNPANLKRGFYEADARAVRYYENLRVVYELESRVRDLQRANDNSAPANPKSSQPEQQPPKQDRPKPNSGTSLRQNLLLPEIQLAAAAACTLSGQPLPASVVCRNRFNRFNPFKEQQALEGGLV